MKTLKLAGMVWDGSNLNIKCICSDGTWVAHLYSGNAECCSGGSGYSDPNQALVSLDNYIRDEAEAKLDALYNEQHQIEHDIAALKAALDDDKVDWVRIDRAYMPDKNKIAAIKEYRIITGAELRAAKEAIERHYK